MMTVKDKNILFSMLFFVGTLLYLEIVVHLYIYEAIDSKIIYPIIFAIPVGIVFTILSGCFERFGNILIMYNLSAVACIIYGINMFYYIFF